MTVPEAKLVLKIDVADLTLGEAALFDGQISPSGLRSFLINHSNWSAAEVNAVKIGELDAVATQINEQLGAAAVPLASEPRSKNGHGSKRKRHRAGSGS